MSTSLPPNDQGKLQRAQILIVEKRYAEARALLVSLNHPIATNWIMQIDAIQNQPRDVRRQRLRSLFRGLFQLALIVLSFSLFLAVRGKYPVNIIARVAVIVSLPTTYFLERATRRLENN
ncbi:MAG: hypothetical protein ABI700_20855 [Chloroflexota bacterium]